MGFGRVLDHDYIYIVFVQECYKMIEFQQGFFPDQGRIFPGGNLKSIIDGGLRIEPETARPDH